MHCAGSVARQMAMVRSESWKPRSRQPRGAYWHLPSMNNGRVTPYEEDLESYRKQLLSADKPSKKTPSKAERPKPASREKILSLRSDVRKSEARLEKLNEMRDKLAIKLADSALYDDTRIGELATWNKKYAEVMEALERAEALWLAAQEKLESAENH